MAVEKKPAAEVPAPVAVETSAKAAPEAVVLLPMAANELTPVVPRRCLRRRLRAAVAALLCFAAVRWGVPYAHDYFFPPVFYAHDYYLPPERWLELCRTHLRHADFQVFERVTGSSVEALLKDPYWRTAPKGELDILRNAPSQKFVPHPMNARGLHALRALLSERLVDYMRKKRKSHDHPYFARFARDGILVLPMANISAGAARLEASGGSPARLLEASEGRITALLRAISGYDRPEVDGFTGWAKFTHFAHDPQWYMHVDTVQPTWKVWVFAPHTRLENGPFHFVLGSHRTTEAKLRWLFDTTRTLLSNADMIKEPEVSPSGPFNFSTHGTGSSLRFQLFDPQVWTRAIAANFSAYGFPRPTPVTTSDKWMLVIADTCGLHYRGYAQPGATREQAKMTWPNHFPIGCDDCMPRKHPFYCTDADELRPTC